MIRTEIQFDEKQYQLLNKLAGQRKTSISDLVHQAAHNLFAGEKREKKSLYAEALKVVGKYVADDADVSQNHDQYLDEAYQ